MMAAAGKFAIVTAVLALGLVPKIERYGQGSLAKDEIASQAVTRFMAAHGWKASPLVRADSGEVFSYFDFTHDDCQASIRVGLVAGNGETTGFARRHHGGDIAFLQGGRFVEQPSALRHQMATISFLLRKSLGLAAAPPLPVLAITPAPVAEAPECRGPALRAWLHELQAG